LALTLGTHAAAVALARNHHLPFYDALIVASAIETGCDILYSEDMQDGRVIGGLITRNGFAETSRILSPSTICSWRAAQSPASEASFFKILEVSAAIVALLRSFAVRSETSYAGLSASMVGAGEGGSGAGAVRQTISKSAARL
jgi:hypothetical protein